MASLLRKAKRLTPRVFCLKYTGYHHHQNTYSCLHLLLTEGMRLFPRIERPVKPPADGHEVMLAHGGADHRGSGRTEGGAPTNSNAGYRRLSCVIARSRSNFCESKVTGTPLGLYTAENASGFLRNLIEHGHQHSVQSVDRAQPRVWCTISEILESVPITQPRTSFYFSQRTKAQY